MKKKPKKQVNQLKKTQPTNLKRNPWKIAFLVLVGLVIGSVAFVTFRATQVREPDLKKNTKAIVEKKKASQSSPFSQKTTSEQTD